MIGVVLRSWVTGRRHGALGYLLLCIVAALGGMVGNIFTLAAPWRSVWWIALFWAVAYAAIAAAAIHPSADTITAPVVDDRLTPARIVALGAAILIAPGIVVVQDMTRQPVDGMLLAVSMVLVVPLALFRVHLLARLHVQAEDRLRHLAQHDELTGLANRRAGEERLRAVLERVADGTSPGAVVAFADLDDFKSVNDGLGHPAGDSLLAQIGRRLSAGVRSDDTVAPFGGDEFLIVCEGDPARVEQRLLDVVEGALAEPFEVAGRVLACRASVGVAAARRGDVVTVDELLSRADAAMYRRKGRPAASARG